MIFEQIGQLAGVTAYLHVHVELSISSIEAQLAKYHELLRTHCALEKAVLNYMMAYVNSSHYIWKEVYGDKPEDLPETSTVKENTRLWFKVAKLHIWDLEDMENNIAALRNSLPAVIGASTGTICPYSWCQPLQHGCLLRHARPPTDSHDERHALQQPDQGEHRLALGIRIPVVLQCLEHQAISNSHHHNRPDHHPKQQLGQIRVLRSQGH